MFKRDKRSILSGLGIITLLVILSTSGAAVLLNNRCQADFRESLVVYPGAEMVLEEYPFLSTQRVIYHTADAPDAVEAWYEQYVAELSRSAVVSGDFSEMPAENWLIEPAQEREGSQIILFTTCP